MMAPATGEDKAIDRKAHQTVQAVAQDIEAQFNKAVARIYELTGAIEEGRACQPLRRDPFAAAGRR